MELHVHGVSKRPHASHVPFPGLVLTQSTLCFAVGRDEEYVHLRLLSGRQDVDLGERLHNFLLLTLARERRADDARGLPDTSCGWLYADQLARDLGVSLSLVNIHVFRARGVLASCGVVDAAALIERRRSTRQLRIGAGQLEIQAL